MATRSIKGFYDWLMAQETDREYDYGDVSREPGQGCAIRQYLNSIGDDHAIVDVYADPEAQAEWRALDDQAGAGPPPYTFGALLARLNAKPADDNAGETVNV